VQLWHKCDWNAWLSGTNFLRTQTVSNILGTLKGKQRDLVLTTPTYERVGQNKTTFTDWHWTRSCDPVQILPRQATGKCDGRRSKFYSGVNYMMPDSSQKHWIKTAPIGVNKPNTPWWKRWLWKETSTTSDSSTTVLVKHRLNDNDIPPLSNLTQMTSRGMKTYSESRIELRNL